jgi:hypothetical protein
VIGAARRRRLRTLLTLVCATVALVAWGASPARAAACPEANPTPTSDCGPEFTLPLWGDAAGWTDPSQYSTIQLADINGDGRDELLGRSDAGLEVWEFDTTLGQWRPQVDAQDRPQVMTDFRSPLPSETGPNWNQPQYYSTIQTSDLDGDGSAEVIARFPAGIGIYEYFPPTGTKNVDGGEWRLINGEYLFSDADGYTDPSLYLSIHASSTGRGVLGRLVSQTGSTTVELLNQQDGWVNEAQTPAPDSDDPAHYLNLQSALFVVNGTAKRAVIDQGAGGMLGWARDNLFSGPLHFSLLGARPNPGPFNTVLPCRPECFNSSPSYYETLRFADIDGKPGDEVLGRLSSGLQLWKLSDDATTWNYLTTLTDLQGAAHGPNPPPPGRWGSIRTANIDGKGGDEVLALDGSGLQTWSYSAGSNSWTKLNPTTPLGLSSDPWDTRPEYYSTIQTGDVDGDGRDDVIARGPFGIRTWFYNRRGTGGWESYLPQDTQGSYPQFSGGRAAAFAALTAQAKDHGVIPAGDSSVRDVWTAENAPQSSDLGQLQQGILSLAGCSGLNPGNPPSYKTCTPPAGSSGFNADDWTAVVNEVLAEIYSGQQVLAHFSDLNDLRRDTFIAQGAALPAIGDQLKLAGAAGNQTTFDVREMFSTVLELTGAIAGEVSGPAGAALSVAGTVLGALPSASPTLTSQLDTTYSGLQSKFASSVAEVDKALSVQSQQVRQSYGLLSLLAQLRSRGTWTLDEVGLKSAANEGFALWAYRELLPTLYARYSITSCVPLHPNDPIDCHGPGAGRGVIGGGANFTALGPPPNGSGRELGTPCDAYFNGQYTEYICTYTTLPADLATTVFGAVSPACAYQPGNPNTAWTFGCNLGVSEQNSVSLSGGPPNGWDFSSYSGDPVVSTSARGRATVGAGGRLRLAGRTILPRRFRLGRARVVGERLLYERGRRGELVRGPSGRTLGPVRLSRRGRRGVLKDPPGGSRVRLRLRRLSGRRVAYVLRASRLRVRVPAACHALAASDALATPDVRLHLRLRISDGGHRRRVSLPILWRCVRARHGGITALRTVRPKRLPARRGLRVSVRGPRTVRPGTSATYRLRVRNRRTRPRSRLRSSLWHVLMRATAPSRVSSRPPGVIPARLIIRRIHELRRGRSKTFRLRVRLPQAARGRYCFSAVALADSARPARARRCARVVPR